MRNSREGTSGDCRSLRSQRGMGAGGAITRMVTQVAWLAALCIAVTDTARAVTVTPIEVTGFTRDSIAETNSLRTSDGFNNTSALHSWFVRNFDGVHQDGLPTGRFVVSSFTNSVTGDHTLFRLSPYDQNNTLILDNQGTGTLTFAQPARFNSIAVLAASIGGGGTANATIRYDDNTTLNFTYNAQDWRAFNNNNNNVFNPYLGSAFEGINLWRYNNDETGHINMYETDRAVDNSKAIVSITFTGAVANNNTGIFAVSGDRVSSVPEPSTLLLLTTGLVGLLGYDWQQRKKTRIYRGQI